MGKVYIAVSVDWDADCSIDRFEESTTHELGKFNEDISAALKTNVPVTHFICPAFYVRDTSLESRYTNSINGLMRPIDEIGLHVHCWKSLVDHALGGGHYKHHPSAFKDGEPNERHDYVSDTGRGIPLGAYDQADIAKIISASITLLEKLDLDATANKGTITSFRSGGWFTNDAVFDAVASCGLTHEASPVAIASLQDEYDEYFEPMYAILRKLWSDSSTYVDPKHVTNKYRRSLYPGGITSESFPRGLGPLVVVPDTGGLAEYITAEHMTDHVSTILEKSVGLQDGVVSVGFHHNNPRGFPKLVESLSSFIDEVGRGAIEFKRISEISAYRNVLRLRGG